MRVDDFCLVQLMSKKTDLNGIGKKISFRNFKALALETLKENPMLVVPGPFKSVFIFSKDNLIFYHTNKKKSIPKGDFFFY